MATRLRAAEHHLTYGMTQCYLPTTPPDIQVNALRLNASQTGWYCMDVGLAVLTAEG